MYRNAIFGPGTLNRLSELLPEDAEHGLVVHGSNSYEAAGIKPRIEDSVGTDIETYVAPSPNPSFADLMDGFEVVSALEPDFVIGVGGGSVIDSAKALSVLPFQPDQPVNYVEEDQDPGSLGVPLYAVTTTAGTGSEATHFATIYVDGIKHSLVGAAVYPTGAVIDPSLLKSVPERVRVATGADALSQAIESYWSVRSTPVSRTLALRAVELAWNNFEQEVLDPNSGSRFRMAMAAHLAGKAIDISKTTACHSVSYPLTAHFGITHGLAVALTVPAFLLYNFHITAEDCIDPRGVEFVQNRIEELVATIGANDASNAARRLMELWETVGIPTSLDQAGVTDIETVIAEGFTPERMGNNPRRVTAHRLAGILASVNGFRT